MICSLVAAESISNQCVPPSIPSPTGGVLCHQVAVNALDSGS